MRRTRDFRDRVVVVTGAAGGIGKAISYRFARAGARVVLVDVDAAAVGRLAADLSAGSQTFDGVACDVSDEESCRRAFAAILQKHGGIDVLVNNAGITQRSLFAETETEVFRRVMGVNFFGSLYCTKLALPSLVERRGLIVVTSSIAGLAPLYERSGYAASKHALHGLFESLRAELAGTGAGVMMVCPGFTATGIGAAALDGHGRAAAHAQSTVGSVATPDSVAEAVFDGATRGRRLVVLTAVGKISALLSKLLPALYERLMARSIRRELARYSRPGRR